MFFPIEFISIMALVKGAGVGMVLGRSAGNSTPFGAAFAANFSTRPPQKEFYVFSSLLARLHKSKVMHVVLRRLITLKVV